MAKARQKQASLIEIPFGKTIGRLTLVNVKKLATKPGSKEINGIKANPFLKWAGGKRSIIEELKKRMPKKFGDYYEPFVGGGALFFEIQPAKSHLSDANADLIITYRTIQKEPHKLITLLKEHQQNHNQEYYYKIRSQHMLSDDIERAARMIYLNKTCFNGLWRVNRKGEFNVPMGSYIKPGICQEENILACSTVLKHAKLEIKNYLTIKPKAGDFVYFDPPYHPVNETSFTAYSSSDFSEKDQAELAEFCKELHKKKVHVMISNSNTTFIRELYASPFFKTGIVNAPRPVNSKASGRSAVEEVLITNY